MTITERSSEYEDAASWACHLYRRSMRVFLHRELRRLPGLTLDKAILEGLRGRQKDDFGENLKKVSSPEYTLGYSEIISLLYHYRSRIFGRYFSLNHDSLKTAVKIRDFRNSEIEHGDVSFLTLERTTEMMQTIADFLAEINDVDARDQILTRREELLHPETVSDSQDEDLELEHAPVEVAVSDRDSIEDVKKVGEGETLDETNQVDIPSENELLEPSIYKFVLKYVHYGVTPRKGTPRFGLLYETPDTGQQVWDNFYLTEKALSRLDWFMGDFGLKTDDLEQVIADEAVRLRIRDRLTRLRSRREFELQIVVTEYAGRQRNEVDRWISPDIKSDYDDALEEVLEDIGDLPF